MPNYSFEDYKQMSIDNFLRTYKTKNRKFIYNLKTRKNFPKKWQLQKRQENNYYG